MVDDGKDAFDSENASDAGVIKDVYSAKVEVALLFRIALVLVDVKNMATPLVTAEHLSPTEIFK